MNPIIQKRYDKAGPRVAAALSRRNMEAFYCPTAIEGAQKVLELIAPEDVVSWGGAMTADEMNLKELLRRRGQPVIDARAVIARAGQAHLDQVADRLFIVHDQDLDHATASFGSKLHCFGIKTASAAGTSG